MSCKKKKKIVLNLILPYKIDSNRFRPKCHTNGVYVNFELVFWKIQI